jgi:hypothetical protein
MTAENAYAGQCPNKSCGGMLYCDPSLNTFTCPYCGQPVTLQTLLNAHTEEAEAGEVLVHSSKEGTGNSPDSTVTPKIESPAGPAFSSRALYRGSIFAVVCYQLVARIFIALLNQPPPYTYNEPLGLIAPLVLLFVLFVCAYYGGLSAARWSKTHRMQHASVVGLVLSVSLLVYPINRDIDIWIQSLFALGGSILPAFHLTTRQLSLGPLRAPLSYGALSKALGFAGFAAVYFCWKAPWKEFSEIVRSGFLSGFFLALAMVARNLEQTLLQRYRDLNAKQILVQTTTTLGADEAETKPVGEETKTGATPRTIQPHHREGAFLLYLRPFRTTGQLNSGNPEYATGPMTPRACTQPKSVEFETRLATAVESFGPLIAFGKPGEHFGSGRIHATEEEWREDFKKLANRAWAIFVLPFNATSTQWEIDWLIHEGLIPKCIFVMPPRPIGDFQAVSKMWSEAREVLSNKGVPLPPYSGDGALFRIGQNEKLTGIQQSSSRRLRRQVLDLLQGGAERNSHTGRIILYVLAAIAALFVIVWLSVDRSPVSVSPGSPYSPPGPVRQEQLATNLPDGGGVTGGHYFSPKWKLAYDIPADWKIKSAAIPERWRARTQDPETNANDISSESHALLFIVL